MRLDVAGGPSGVPRTDVLSGGGPTTVVINPYLSSGGKEEAEKGRH